MSFQRPGTCAAPACALLLTVLAATPAASADDGVTLRPRKGHLRAGRTLTIIAPANCADPGAQSDAFPGVVVRLNAAKGRDRRPVGTVAIARDAAPGHHELVVTCAGVDQDRMDDRLLYAQLDVLPRPAPREHHKAVPRQREHAHPPEHLPLPLFPAEPGQEGLALKVSGAVPGALGRAAHGDRSAARHGRESGGMPSGPGAPLAGAALGALWWGLRRRRGADA